MSNLEKVHKLIVRNNNQTKASFKGSFSLNYVPQAK